MRDNEFGEGTDAEKGQVWCVAEGSRSTKYRGPKVAPMYFSPGVLLVEVEHSPSGAVKHLTMLTADFDPCQLELCDAEALMIAHAAERENVVDF